MQAFGKSLLAAALCAAVSTAQATDSDASAPVNFVADADIRLRVLGTFETGVFDAGAAEIAAYDPRTRRVFVTNADANTVDVLSIRNPRRPQLRFTIDLAPFGDGVNSVAVKNGLVAVAVEADPKQDPGGVVFFDPHGRFLNALTVGALPDMVTFTPDGTKVLVANEGEPDDDYILDPQGTVSIIDVSANVTDLTDADVVHVDFTAFDDRELPGVRVFGPDFDESSNEVGTAPLSADAEPEYIAVSGDSQTAYVSLQENNALAIIDLASATVTDVIGLGTKDHGVIQNALDASNRDDVINIRPWPVVGMFQPDAIAAYEVAGKTYLVTVNEGDAREYEGMPGFLEEARVKDVDLDRAAYPDADDLKQDDQLGRLKLTTATGDSDGDGDIDVIHAFGARSFSIFDAEGNIVYDSGSDFERRIADVIPADFNSTNDENGSFDDRSDDKGPEPEGVTVGQVGRRTYAFIGLERVGGIMVYDITNPIAPLFVQYINNRHFAGDAEAGTAGDLAPEGVLFIPAAQAPEGQPLLVVANEVSGSTTVYAVQADDYDYDDYD